MRRIVIVLILAFATLVYAHEGHRPLPTRGMEIDVVTGKMVLTKSSRDLLDVRTEDVITGLVEESIATYGQILVPWNQHAVIASPLSGRIVELLVKPGETVEAGQVVAKLDSLELQQLVLELRAAQVELLLSEKLVANLESASQSGAVPGSRLRDSQAKMLQDRAAVQLGRAKWDALKLPPEMLDRILTSPEVEHQLLLDLRTPISGVVTHADLSLGKIVNPKEHLFEILDLSRVWLKIQVLEKDLSKCEIGQRVVFEPTAQRELQYEAVIDIVDSYLDPSTHFGTVWATLSIDPTSSSTILPGMAGKVRIQLGGNDGKLVMPHSAVMRDGAERFVLVEQEQTEVASIYQKQVLALGSRIGQQIEVLSGNLYPGDRVVTQGVHELGGYFAKGVLKIGAESARDIGLQTEVVTSGSVAETFSVDGIVDLPPTHRSVGSAQMSGTIERILIDRGQVVSQGQVLAEISSQPFKNLQLDLLQSEIEARLLAEVVNSLREARDAIAARQLWESESQLNQVTTRRENLIQQLRTIGISPEQVAELLENRRLIQTLPIKAPIDGVIVGFDKFLGHVVVPDEPLFEVHDLSHAWIQGFVSEQDFPRIEIGQSVRVRFVAAPDEIAEGTVVRSGQAISSDDRTLAIWVELRRSSSLALRHRMMARLEILTGKHSDGLAIPRTAIVREGLRSYVFVERENQTFERRYVVTGPSDDLRVTVLQGLEPGETVATRGAQQLQSGYAALK